jgi:hypothetical protein
LRGAYQVKRILFIVLFISSLGAHALELPNVSVKDRLRLELWSFGMDKVALNSESAEAQELRKRPELRPEILKPLRDLVLEL